MRSSGGNRQGVGNISTYGYIRVSTRDQNEDRQLLAMRELPIPEKNIYIDKQSGKDFERPQYKKLVRRLKKDDLLYVKSIDRLGRNYKEILEQWQVLTQEKGIDIVVMDMPLLDTRQGRDLTGRLIADIVLQLLSYVAETERQNIRQRQAEGIQAARRRGAQLGRQQIEMPAGFHNLARAWHRGEISSRAAAEKLGVSHQTFLRRVKEVRVRWGK